MSMSGEKKKRSLRNRAFRVILAGALLLILLISSAGLGVHIYATMKNYHDESRHLMAYTMSLLDQAYVEEIFAKTKEVYDALPEEVRSDPYSQEFMNEFLPLVDDDFFAARSVLEKCRVETENRNVSLVFTDKENSAIVFAVDGDELDWAYLPGQWIGADIGQIERVENSGWRLMLTREDAYGWIGTDYSTIRSEDGTEIGYIVLDVDMNDFMSRVFRILIFLVPASVTIVLLAGFLASRLLDKHVISNITSMAGAARDYTARDKVEDIENGTSYFAPLAIRTDDELQDLWESMTDMEADITDTMRRLKTVTAEQERLAAELNIAKEIQEGTLPRTFPAFPDRTEFDLYASMTPAKEVGGDFYDYFLIDDDHLAIVIADVSGKGISAALFMVNSKGTLQNEALAGSLDVGAVCAKANARLAAQNEAMMFVTVWLGILTISTGEVVYVNAGHEYPAIRRKDGLFTVEKDVHSGPMAASARMKFKSGSFTLNPGDTLYLYTDGVTEANNSEEELFGTDRMLEALNTDPDADAKTVDDNVRAGIAAFVGEAPQFDDTTMLTFKYLG